MQAFAFLIFILLLFLVLSIILCSLYFRYNRSGRLFAKIPGPKGWPVIGNIIDVLLPADKVFTYTRNLNKEFKGGLSKLNAFGVRMLNVYDPDDVEIILSTPRFNEKRHPYTFLTPWLSQGLLVSNGHKWQQRRKLLTSAFHFNILKQFAITFSETTEELLDRLQEEVGSPKTDIVPIVSTATLRIMCETSMGTSMYEGIQSATNMYFSAIQTLGGCVLYRMLRPWLYPDWVFSLTTVSSIQNAALRYLHGFTNRIIQERKIARNGNDAKANKNLSEYGRKIQRAMLDLLLECEKDNKIDEDGIREEVDTFMFEGHDTTAMALCFMIMRIANENAIQDKICKELEDIFGDSKRLPTNDDLNEMKYLECCIKESMRIYPSVPLIARHISEEVTLSGYKVPVGTICQVHLYDMHRREDVFPEPEKFIPERFCNVKRHPYAYIPFSAGPRNCIGQKFAMMEMKTVMSGVLRRFRLEPVTRPEDVTFSADLVLRANHPLHVRFVLRN